MITHRTLTTGQMTVEYMPTTNDMIEYIPSNSDSIGRLVIPDSYQFTYTPDVRRMIMAGALCNVAEFINTFDNGMKWDGPTTDKPIAMMISDLGLYNDIRKVCFFFLSGSFRKCCCIICIECFVRHVRESK